MVKNRINTLKKDYETLLEDNDYLRYRIEFLKAREMYLVEEIENLRRELDEYKAALDDAIRCAEIGGRVTLIDGSEENERLHAENARLREALVPFAAIYQAKGTAPDGIGLSALRLVPTTHLALAAEVLAPTDKKDK